MCVDVLVGAMPGAGCQGKGAEGWPYSNVVRRIGDHQILRKETLMAKAGDTIDNPVTGERIVVLQSARETDGELFAFELSVKPHGFVSAEHIHLKQEETFEVTRGTIRFRINGQEADAVVGQGVVVPSGTPHSWWNESSEEVAAIVWLRPALNTETFFETFFGLARDGKTNKRGLPNIFQTAVLVTDYQDVTKVLLPPPLPFLLKLLTPLARLLGYRSSYPQYSSAQPRPEAELLADA
jgi:quercetin dioxygenase-like cupin family protein